MSKVHAQDSEQNQIKVNDPIRDGLAAVVKGQDVEEAVYGKHILPEDSASFEEDNFEETLSPMEELEQSISEEDEEDNSQESGEEEESSEGEPSVQEMLNSEKASKKAKEDSDIEHIVVKGPDGRKQKLKVDYSDKKAIKQAYLKAAGMRKFQAERDSERSQKMDIQKKHSELQEDWDKLEGVWDKDGVKGLVNLLGGPNAWEEAYAAETKHQEYLNNLSPAEKYKLDMQKEQQAATRKQEELQQKYQELLDQTKKSQEEADTRRLESQLHPSFDRYRFAGRLGDPVAEHGLDETVWSKALGRLGQYEEKGIELTQAIIDKEFRDAAGSIRKVLNQQTEKKIKSAIENKKVEASKRAQITAKKGLKNNQAKSDFVSKMKSGDIKGSVMDVLSGKVKL